MGLDLQYINGQTPIDEDEKIGLLIETIATRSELDEFEQQNIEEAMQWVLGSSLKPETILSESFLRNIHKRMFSQVWAWAGKYRLTNKNLGIDKWEITTATKSLCDDALYWINNETFPPDEIAVRFKHSIVRIHCFPNGNGRHSRLMADIIINKIYNRDMFSWGESDLAKQGDSRANYLEAIREADKGDFKKLLEFSRS